MQKTFYFGLIDEEEFPDATDTFYQNGKHYWYKIEVDTAEDVYCIHDTCGRHMPLDMVSLGNLSDIFSVVDEIRLTEKEEVANLERRLSGEKEGW
jgi:hypothetical protein